MTKGMFITGTDTGIGKTEIALGLIESYKRRGRRVAAMKPVASGATPVDGQLRNEDAQRLLAACNVELTYPQVNPYVFEEPIAPHIAAANAGVGIDIERIAQGYEQLCQLADVVIVEGVGGWLVPWNDMMTVADVPRRLDIPVVLVVGMRLGCLNHALLSEAAIRQCDVDCVGWVANTIVPGFLYAKENLRTLERRIDAPFMGEVDYHSPLSVDFVADALQNLPMVK